MPYGSDSKQQSLSCLLLGLALWDRMAAMQVQKHRIFCQASVGHRVDSFLVETCMEADVRLLDWWKYPRHH